MVSCCFDLKLSTHKSQGKLRSWFSFVVCLFLCAARWCLRRKFWWQISHSNRRSRSWIWTCAFKAVFSVHTNSHILHLNCLLEHTFSCACRWLSSWKRSLQNEQWNGSSDRCRLRCRCFEKERETYHFGIQFWWILKNVYLLLNRRFAWMISSNIDMSKISHRNEIYSVESNDCVVWKSITKFIYNYQIFFGRKKIVKKTHELFT